jgi:hypothetical protein
MFAPAADLEQLGAMITRARSVTGKPTMLASPQRRMIPDLSSTFFVRHGATTRNLRGMRRRCDLD